MPGAVVYSVGGGRRVRLEQWFISGADGRRARLEQWFILVQAG